jgi:TPR repeat protein
MALALLLTGCNKEPVSSEGAYNRGVDAYRAKDYESARALWSIEVAKGNVHAENNLGYLLYYGLGGEADKQRGVALWRKAAEAGMAESQWHLASAFHDGEAMPKDLSESYAWSKCAVATGEASQGEHRDDDRDIASHARKHLDKLRPQMSRADIEQAEALAARYIRQYLKAAH